MAVCLQKSAQHVPIHLDVVNDEHRTALDTWPVLCHKNGPFAF
jgi:hypothetical protein